MPIGCSRNAPDSNPDFLVVGNVTRDLMPDGSSRPGGTSLYAALAARNLGFRAAVLTSGESISAPSSVLDGVDLVHVPSASTPTFQNVYTSEGRRQRLLSTGDSISAFDVPVALRGARVVLLGPVAGEIDEGVEVLFEGALMGVSLQGWLRAAGPGGWVERDVAPRAYDVISKAGVAFCSEEDVAGDEDLVRRFAALTPVFVFTRGSRGATVFEGGKSRHVPAFLARDVDPTGAGDVFAAAFLLHYRESGHAADAARFAHCVASFVVEAPGWSGVPRLEDVCRRLAEHGETRLWEKC